MTADHPDLIAGTPEPQAVLDPASLVPGALTANVFRGRPVSVRVAGSSAPASE